MKLKRVVITGIGALTPIGNNAVDFWTNLKAGVNGVALITRFDTTHFKTKFACELKNFDISQYLNEKEARRWDICSQYGLVASTEAIQDAHLDLDNENRDRIGVIYGCGIGGIGSTSTGLFDHVNGGHIPHFNPFFIPKALINMPASLIAIKHDLRGVNYATVAACASAAYAISDAFHYIQLGKADVIVAGGSEAGIGEAGIGGFNAMHALSTRNDNYQTASRPFSVGRDGFVLGEGAGALILEDYEHAIQRNAHIYAEIIGVGASADAYHISSPLSDGRGIQKAMLNAIEDGGLKPTDIDHINTHGTATVQGDLAECVAIETIFGDHAKDMIFNSVKSMIGHLMGASAAVESIATILSLRDGIIPPTINLIERDPNIPDWNFCANQAVEREIHYALCNAFGFGGHNASLLFKKFEK